MKFIIHKMLLWLENDTCREVEFQANKVNVITGDSGTGKSAILDIIDYCFFASKTEIPDEQINENVKWYGLNFSINNKTFTIARSKFRSSRSLSKEYYFSAIGNIPDLPVSNMSEKECKTILEQEFSIDQNIVIPYGGKKLSAGSKISLRYFFMFNTQSEDIITSKHVFFDKQSNEKYREALERIFDIATGIETIENILIREKMRDIEKEINRLEKKKLLYENEASLYEENKAELVKKAKEYNLIDTSTADLNTSLLQLKEVVFNYKESSSSEPDNISNLKNQKSVLLRKINTYKNFQKQYKEYKEVENNNLQSLKPITYIMENFYEVIQTPDMKGLLLDFEKELYRIKTTLNQKYPLNLNINSEIKKLEEELKSVESLLKLAPTRNNTFSNDIEKYIFIGELRRELSMYDDQKIAIDQNYETQITRKKALLEELQNSLDESTDRNTAIQLLQELIDKYLEQSKDALGTYSGYKAAFDDKHKQLKLRKPGTANPSTVGSSSNHLFLHLCLFLGLHELIIKQDSPFVPQFLILDQPSRPYYGEDTGLKKQKTWEEVNLGDKKKITIAMKLLNDFITYINKEFKRDFQIIILEHIPKSIWEEAKLENFHLVEEFKEGGNSLINI
ncbi:DUF3732 domain-containing protein [Bacillus mycoides]|uniref:DUF3732 domain-containing protein n=1 Tax=Bacillus mycoides TaxID=1405 RepID=UPI0034646E7B